MLKPLQYSKLFVGMLAVSFLLRLFFAAFTEFGNDEAYYWVLFQFPALSHFDHPPLTFLFIRIFTLFGHWDAEWIVRLPSIVGATIATILLYDLGRKMHSEKVGFWAALLAQSSPYFFVISGITIIPDGVLSAFWMAALRSFYLHTHSENRKTQNLHLLLFGLWVGLGSITKYHILSLWASFALFHLSLIFTQKDYFKKLILNPFLYFSILITVLSFSPVILWNLQHQMASLGYHESRLSFFDSLEPLFFARELLGQWVYNNPIFVSLALISMIGLLRKKIIPSTQLNFILSFSLPLLGLFLFFSLFRATLPHWSAPGYYPLFLLVALSLNSKTAKVQYRWLITTVGFSIVLYSLAFGIIQKGWFIDATENRNPATDVTLDLYGWDQMGNEFLKNAHSYPGNTQFIVAKKWHNAAHLDYNLCRKADFKLYALGDLADLHEYHRINLERGLTKVPDQAYALEPQREGCNPHEAFGKYYAHIQCIDTLHIYRNANEVELVYVYYLKRDQNTENP